jgi:hypothetical protein
MGGMNPIVERSLTAVRTFFRRLGDWVAGFTFWRFVLFSILTLAAAGMIGDALVPAEQQTVIVKKSRRTPDAQQGDNKPAEGIKAKPGNEGCHEEVQIGPSGIHITDCATGDSADADPADVTHTMHKSGGGNRLANLMLAILAVLWVVWFVGRSRLKTEARVDQAEAIAEKASLERQVAEARLQALQAQVEPHFLFNTLGAVEHLIETDPPRAATMQRHLIAFLRGAMPRMRGEAVTLGDEVDLCRNYLAIMKIRMEDRLDYNIDLPAELAGASFPPMMLQSVVENAIKHGLEPKAEGGSIRISARAAAGRLRVSVADSGLGFGVADTAGTGIGLNNIRERLAGLFGDQAALVVSPNAPTGAQVTIEIPHGGNNGNHRG